jgi:hypothetical protein
LAQLGKVLWDAVQLRALRHRGGRVMAIHIINGQKIVTSHDYPPIPIRSMDWSATSDNFDADWDGERYIGSHPIGHGPTEDAAIADYLELIEEAA